MQHLHSKTFPFMDIFTVRKRSCGKVMFLHLSVSHSGHRGVYSSMHGGRHTPWADSPWANTPLQTPHLPSACWDTHPHCPVHGWNTCPPPPGGYCCRRYASIWNAFLYKVFLYVIKDVICSVHLALILNFYSR